MWKCWILMLCVSGISSVLVEPQNISSPVENRPGKSGQSGQSEPIKRFSCPIGFFRLKRYCYYLSAGTAAWRDAYFHCRDRNATLTILDRSAKDRMLRKYLMGDQFTKLERWIGGIFNWQKMAWEWGVSGEKMDFQSFARADSEKSQHYAWHCIIMDPFFRYKWSPRSCVERKHYVCEVPAGRLARRRKTAADPFAPQNQRLKPREKAKKYLGEARKREKSPNPSRRKKPRTNRGWRKKWIDQDHQWANGLELGSRPPSSNNGLNYWRNLRRHRPNRNKTQTADYSTSRVAQISDRGREYGAFLADGTRAGHNHQQSLTDMSNVLSDFHSKINEFAREEILLKP